MARVIVSSSNFLRHVRAHNALGADYMTLAIELDRPGCLSCKSATGSTELPCESRWHGGNARVSVGKLLLAFKHIEDQPITLDLHDGLPCLLYAVKRSPMVLHPDILDDVVFDI